MEKVWTWDSLITKYMVEKTRRGYDASCTPEEISDFLDFISYFVTVTHSDVNYKDALKNYLNGLESKSKEWNIRKEDFEYFPIVEQLNSGLIVPTYKLISALPEYGDFDFEKKAYDEKFISYLTKYMEKNCSKRKIITCESLDNDTVQFGEKVAASLLMQIWNDRKNRYQRDGMWPNQCNDIKKHLLDRDLSSIIELPAMREELIDFYFTVSERIMHVAQDNSDFKMTNFEEEVLAKSNFDLVMGGFPYYRTVNRRQEGIIIDRSKNELQTVTDYYDGNVKKDNLDNPKVLTLVRDLNHLKEK